MPHSPRLHAGRIWMLDSGRGRLLYVNRDNGNTETIAELLHPKRPRSKAAADASTANVMIRLVGIMSGR
jgi:hypothetical protein